ncbi:LpqN/LpqT family lipoprotein [[Mycobacterium] wendilense]|uniref:LpqN/LpqT family lipoprotein n=1 Tax=[Mycobacterium] wendilense TaxID=3064284 RepID=A0ABN9NV26_9MYCO|nr:LpqN/LpqT family lipoprotein [Mycolicibacterium sp. MU0050]CAJ1580266.1 LpqN/LpqT family lipoprotein [Mycolicibacterium sp. MU0050]
MTRRLRLTAAAAALLVCAGCATPAPDYQSIWSTTTTPNPTPTSSEPPVPFSQYLAGVGVQGEAVALDDLTELSVTLVRPAGWSAYRNENLAPQTEGIAKNNTYPTATVLVFRLDGGFDVPAAIRRANADALLSPGFTKLNESFDDFDGFPSAMIEGSYFGPSEPGSTPPRLHSYSRIVIPVTPDFQRYLVQLTITGLADQAVADSADIEEIISGFEVTVR